MLVYIDESGDPGFKLELGATPIFVLAMVHFADYKKADDARSKIHDLSIELGISEFKFSKTSNDYKRKFFELAANLDFLANLLVVDKSIIYNPQLKTKKESFYSYFVKQVIANDGGLFKNALSVYIDGSGSKQLEKFLASYLRKEIGISKIRAIKFVDSKKEPLIQLADMIAGASHRSARKDGRCNSEWLDLVSKKVNQNWLFK